MARTNVLPADAPAWFTKDRQINELIYSCSFLSAHPMKCIHGRFFTVDGLVPDEGSLKLHAAPWIIAICISMLFTALPVMAAISGEGNSEAGLVATRVT